jgi:hypothetical protein
MSALNIKKLSVKLQSVASKNKLESKDLAMLREIKEGIAQALQLLKECDACGAAVLEIARLELDGVRAAVCPACGIKALKNRSLVINKVKKKAASGPKATVVRRQAPLKPREKRKGIKRRTIRESHTPKKRTRLHMPAVRKNEPRRAEQTALKLDTKPVQADTSQAFEQIAKECSEKISVVRKVFQIANSVAFPMNMERTINYTKMEAQSQGIVLDISVLKKMLILLVKKAGLKVRD